MLTSARRFIPCCWMRLSAATCSAASVTMVPKRTTVIMQHVYPPRLAPKGRLPIVKQKNRILRMVERVHDQKSPDITCILTDIVDGVGKRGEVVAVKRRFFRNKLYPAGLAEYASPENMLKWEEELKGQEGKDESLGVFGEMTARQLQGMHLRVPMSGDNDWTLTVSHVRIALRKSGVEVEDKCITLPAHPITEAGPFSFRITINGLRSIDVKGTIFLRFNDSSKYQHLDLPPTWQPIRSRGKKQDVIPQ